MKVIVGKRVWCIIQFFRLNGINGPKPKPPIPIVSRSNVPTVPGPGPVQSSPSLIIQVSHFVSCVLILLIYSLSHLPFLFYIPTIWNSTFYSPTTLANNVYIRSWTSYASVFLGEIWITNMSYSKNEWRSLPNELKIPIQLVLLAKYFWQKI